MQHEIIDIIENETNLEMKKLMHKVLYHALHEHSLFISDATDRVMKQLVNEGFVIK